MKTLKFRKKLAQLIIDGNKTTTWRLFDDKNLSVGDCISFRISETGEEFLQIEILSTNEVKFNELTQSDWEGHEKYDSEKKMYETFEKYYNRTVDGNTLVKIIKFRSL